MYVSDTLTSSFLFGFERAINSRNTGISGKVYIVKTESNVSFMRIIYSPSQVTNCLAEKKKSSILDILKGKALKEQFFFMTLVGQERVQLGQQFIIRPC